MKNINETITADWTVEDWDKMYDWLHGMLMVTEATITFVKKDGTERVMRCTLEPDKLPRVEIKEDKEPRKKSTTTMSVYDLEVQGWRSFTVKSIKRIHMVIE